MDRNFPFLPGVQYSEAVNDDDRLIDETLAGKSASFGQLVQKYQDRLFNTLVHVTGSPDDALDIVQDAFVQAFVKLESFRGRSAFYTWLYRIAFNVAATQRRRRRPVTSVDQARREGGDEPADPNHGPLENLEQQDAAAWFGRP